MAGSAGLEPATFGSKGRRSTIELRAKNLLVGGNGRSIPPYDPATRLCFAAAQERAWTTASRQLQAALQGVGYADPQLLVWAWEYHSYLFPAIPGS